MSSKMNFRDGRRDAAPQNDTGQRRGFKELKDKDFKDLNDFKGLKEDGVGGIVEAVGAATHDCHRFHGARRFP